MKASNRPTAPRRQLTREELVRAAAKLPKVTVPRLGLSLDEVMFELTGNRVWHVGQRPAR